MKRWFSLRPTKTFDEAPPPPSDATPVLSDEELLRKFVIERDDRAFALLVGRHSGLVMGVCRRVVGLHDAEDAFQAVFLILARKADALRHGSSLPAWLHKTAFRTALRARADRSRRREQSAEGTDMIAHETCAQIASDHQGSIVDEELNRLPERYRLPLYLCCIEGKSLDVAARQLGWSVGSVKGRLERGRSELRRRLLLRRVPFALGITALALTATSAQAAATTAVAPSLIASTVQAGMQYAVGRSALGYVSQHALHLAQGSWKIMSLTTLKITVCSLTLAGLAGLGGSYFTVPVSAGGSSSRGIVLEASLPSTPALEYQLALADEGPKPGVRDGERPRTAPRDGEQPRRPAAEGEQPRRPAAEGEQPRRPSAEGEQPRRPAAEGERRPGAEGAPRPNPIEGFKPQTDREAVLMQMIMQLQREVSELRRAVQTREGGVLPRREDGAARPGPREGDGAPRTGPRDGEKPRTGPRDGEQPRTGPRDGEGAKPGPREGDGAPKKE